MSTSKLTRERIEDIIARIEMYGHGAGYTADEVWALARLALAGMNSEPVAATGNGLNVALSLTQMQIDWICNTCASIYNTRNNDVAQGYIDEIRATLERLAAMDSEPVFTLEVSQADYKGQKLGNHFGFITLDAARNLKEGNYQLYRHAQPVTVVPDELKEAAADFLTVLDEYPEQLVPINRDSAVVRALRAAMLNQAPVKQPSSNPKSEHLQRAEKLAEDAAALVERVGGATCAWGSDDSGTWSGSCGAEWQFFDDGPVENSMNFCPGCGKPVSVK